MLRGFLLFHGHPFTQLLAQVSSLTQSSRITLLYYFFISSAQQRKAINSLSVCVLIYEILVAKRLGNCQSEEYSIRTDDYHSRNFARFCHWLFCHGKVKTRCHSDYTCCWLSSSLTSTSDPMRGTYPLGSAGSEETLAGGTWLTE